jgi:hypothetical protein
MDRRPAAPLLLFGLLVAARCPAADVAPRYSTASRADIRDLGAVPGPGGAAATRRALQAAIDSNRPIAWVPNHPSGWWIDRPVFLDVRGKAIRSDGALLHVQAENDLGLVVGILRRPRGKALTPDHIVKADPYLDETARGRWAIRTRGDAHFAQQWGNITGPPGRWRTARLVLDFAVDLRRTGENACLLGWGSGTPQPINIWAQPGGLYVRFRASDGKTRSFHVPHKNSFHRFSIQIDAAAATISCWVDRLQVAPTGAPDLDAWRPDSARTLGGNFDAPFFLGALNDASPGGVADWFGNACDATFCGLRIGTELLYADGPPGSRQRFRAGTTRAAQPALTDANQFFEFLPGTSVLLPLTDPPEAVAADRLIRVGCREPNGSNNYGWGLLLSNDGNGVDAMVDGLELDGLNVVMHSPYGCTVAVGMAVGFRMRDAAARGGSFGVGSWDFSPGGWITRIQGGRFSGARSGIRLKEHMVYLEDLEIVGADVACFDLPKCVAHIDRSHVVGAAGPDYAIRGSGQLVIGQLTVDYEDSVHPAKALIDWTSYGGKPEMNLLRWAFLASGPMGKDAVLVDLHDDPRGANTSELAVGSVSLIGKGYPAMIRCDGPSWLSRDPLKTFIAQPPGVPTYRWVGPKGKSGLRAEDD